MRSLDLVAAASSCTSSSRRPTRLVHAARRLGADDDFPAAVCGMGCMGIVDSLVLEVRARFFLRERRPRLTWAEARAELAGGVLDRHDHYELFLDPYGEAHGCSSPPVTRWPSPTTRRPATACATR